MKLLVSAVAFIATGLLLIVPANALENVASSNAHPTLVGIGDSYTSGAGNEPYTSESEATGCNRSRSAYPAVAATALQLDAVNYACSGATTDAFTSSFKSEPAQTSRIGDAKAVVFTIGGNDVGALNTIAGGDLSGIPAKLQALPAKLNTAYDAVKAAAPHSEIFAVTYPDIFPTDDTVYQACRPAALQNVALSDLHSAVASLNRVIKATAVANGIHVVDASDVLAGHDICSRDSWVTGLTSSEPLHPNVNGQKAIGTAVANDVQAILGDTTSSSSSSTSSTSSSTTSTTDVEPNGCGCTHESSTSSTSSTKKPTTTTTKKPTTTTTSSTSTTVPDVIPATVPTIVVAKPTAQSSTTTSSTSTTSTTEQPSTTTSTVKPAEVKAEVVERNQLAQTGADVTRGIAIGIVLVGIGLAIVWARNYVRKHSDEIR